MEGVTSVGLLLQEAEEAAADRPTPELIPVAAPGDPDEDGDGDHRTTGPPVGDAAKRERRRQRRKSRPHGRSR
jgi:hypothetical protein